MSKGGCQMCGNWDAKAMVAAGYKMTLCDDCANEIDEATYNMYVEVSRCKIVMEAHIHAGDPDAALNSLFDHLAAQEKLRQAVKSYISENRKKDADNSEG